MQAAVLLPPSRKFTLIRCGDYRGCHGGYHGSIEQRPQPSLFFCTCQTDAVHTIKPCVGECHAMPCHAMLAGLLFVSVFPISSKPSGILVVSGVVCQAQALFVLLCRAFSSCNPRPPPATHHTDSHRGCMSERQETLSIGGVLQPLPKTSMHVAQHPHGAGVETILYAVRQKTISSLPDGSAWKCS